MTYSCPLGNNSIPISIDDNYMLRKDDNGTSMIGITKHPAIHAMMLPKYVVPYLRGPNLVWVPSKRGWIYVGTKGIGGLIKMKFILLISWLNQEIETYCIHQTPMPWQVNEVKSAFNIQVQLSSCGEFIGHIWWLANIWVDSCFWMIMSYQSMIMCWSISFGCIWVDWIGNIHILLAMRCLNGLNV